MSYQQLVQYYQTHGHCEVDNRVNIKLGRWVAQQRLFYRQIQNQSTKAISSRRGNPLKSNRTRIDALNQIEFCWEPGKVRWRQRFDELRKFQEKYGHTFVPLHYEENRMLGSWVAQQRILYNRRQDFHHQQQKQQQRIELLNNIGFCWNIYESNWNQRYNELVQFQKVHGHTDVPQKNSPLGPWVARQRYFYRQLQHVNNSSSAADNPLHCNPTRIQALNKINFCWDPNVLKWNQRYEELQHFQHKYGHCDVPLRHINHRQLAVWVNNQRLQYKSNTLSKERIDRLQQLKFSWVSSSTEQWYERYEELCEHQKRHGNTLVPKNHFENPALGYWVNSQRVQYKKYLLWQKQQQENSTIITTPAYSRLTPDRIDALNRIGFQWQVLEDRWNTRYQELCMFRNIHGHCHVPQVYPPNQDLANWVVHQRTHYRYAIHGEYTALTPDRIERLSNLNFCWNYPNHTWYEMLHLFKSYMGAHGNKTLTSQYIPTSDVLNRPLRIWIKNQRYEYSKLMISRAAGGKTRSLLTPDRLEALNSIGFQWEGYQEAKRLRSIENIDKYHPDGRLKKHWFDGMPRIPSTIEWDTDVNSLWNAEDDF